MKRVGGFPGTGRGRLFATAVEIEAGLSQRPAVDDDGLELIGRAAPAQWKPATSVVIPAKNEAANLPYVLGRLSETIDEVILVDGHSLDDTVAVATRLCPRVTVVRQAGNGKGDALARGCAVARGPIIVTMDADGSNDPAEIPRFVDALLDGCDFAKGSRFLPGGGSADLTPLRSFGNRVLVGLVNIIFGTQYTDLCYGYNAFWASCLPALDIDCDGFEVETLMSIRLATAGLRVTEVPSFEALRLNGASNLNVCRDGWRVMLTILRGARRRPRGRRRRADREVG